MKSKKNNHKIQRNYSNVCILWNFFQCQYNFSNRNVRHNFFFFFVITIFSSLFSQPNSNLNVLAPYKIRLKLVISFSVTIGCFL